MWRQGIRPSPQQLNLPKTQAGAKASQNSVCAIGALAVSDIGAVRSPLCTATTVALFPRKRKTYPSVCLMMSALTNRETRLIAIQRGANVPAPLAVRMLCAKRIQWTHSLTVHGILHALLPRVQIHQQMPMRSPIG